MKSTLEVSIGNDELNFDINKDCLVHEVTVEINNRIKYIDCILGLAKLDDNDDLSQVIRRQ